MGRRREEGAPVPRREPRRRGTPELLVPTSAARPVFRPGFEALVRSWSPTLGRSPARPRVARAAGRLPLDGALAPPSHRLLAAARGDAEAFDALIAPLREPLVRLAERRVPERMRGRFDAHDLVQSACLRAFRHFGTFRPETGGHGFLAWIVRVLDSAIRDELRRHARLCRDPHREAALEPEHEPALDGEQALLGRLMLGEERERLATALAHLPRLDRTVLVERYFEGLTHAEIARRHHWSEPTARRRQRDALARLSSLL